MHATLAATFAMSAFLPQPQLPPGTAWRVDTWPNPYYLSPGASGIERSKKRFVAALSFEKGGVKELLSTADGVSSQEAADKLFCFELVCCRGCGLVINNDVAP